MRIDTYSDWAIVVLLHALVVGLLMFLWYQNVLLTDVNVKTIQELKDHRAYIKSRDWVWEHDYLPVIQDNNRMLKQLVDRSQGESSVSPGK